MKPPVVVTLDACWYLWCSCGATSRSPFCDASHVKRHGFDDGKRPRPKAFKIARDQTSVKLCRCFKTKTPPFCDDTHLFANASVDVE